METANEAFKELERRIEKSRELKSKLGHELGKENKEKMDNGYNFC